MDEYIALVVDYIQRLRPDLVLERFVSQSPKELLIAPDWGLKNYEFNHRLQKRMKELDANWTPGRESCIINKNIVFLHHVS